MYHENTAPNVSGCSSCDGAGNNKTRFRVDFEELDNPGVGIGEGPSEYHITGGKSTTKLSGIKELGWWGGRNIGSDTVKPNPLATPLLDPLGLLPPTRKFS